MMSRKKEIEKELTEMKKNHKAKHAAFVEAMALEVYASLPTDKRMQYLQQCRAVINPPEKPVPASKKKGK